MLSLVSLRVLQKKGTPLREVIRELIHGLCAVPSAVRLEWLDELFKNGTETDAVAPDDLIVRMVLANLDTAEGVAAMRRDELKGLPRNCVRARPAGGEAAYRAVITALVRAMLAVPRPIRERWKDELMAEDGGRLSPEESVVRFVLINLNAGEGIHEKELSSHSVPKLRMVARNGHES